MKLLLESFVIAEINKMCLKENLAGFLVKKKKRGTYQALEEGRIIEKDIMASTLEYIEEWMLSEFLDGALKKVLIKEIDNQILMELSRRGFNGINKK